MAERRMFSKKIVASGDFLCLSPTARLLYYDLGMHADDDGVAEALPVMRMTGAEQSDLDALAAHGYLQILTPSLVVHLVHWQRHNHVQKDRYQPSLYQHLIPPALRPRYTARRTPARPSSDALRPAQGDTSTRQDLADAPDESFLQLAPDPGPEPEPEVDPCPDVSSNFVRQYSTPASDPEVDPCPDVSRDFVRPNPTPESDPGMDPCPDVSRDFVRPNPTPASDPELDPSSQVSSNFIRPYPTPASDPEMDPCPDVSSNFVRQYPTPESDKTSIRPNPAPPPDQLRGPLQAALFCSLVPYAPPDSHRPPYLRCNGRWN